MPHRNECGPFRTSRSSDMRTMPFATAPASRRHGSSGVRWPIALRPASEKTKIVYCKDAFRQGDFPVIAFDFLGYQFRARKTMWRRGARRIFTHGFSRPEGAEAH
jgi:hypothetical protein